MVLLVLALLSINGLLFADINQKEDINLLEEYTIFEVCKISRTDIFMGVLDFTVIITGDEKRDKKCFLVRPDELSIKVRSDGSGTTTLKTLARYKKEVFVPIISPAILLVPTEEDRKTWNDYIEEAKQEYKLVGRVDSAVLDLLEGEFQVLILTKPEPQWFKELERPRLEICVEKVFVALENISICVNKELAKDYPTWLVYWSEYRLEQTIPDGCCVFAKKLTVYVVDEEQQKEWEVRIKSW